MSTAIIGYSPVMTELFDSVDTTISRIRRYRIRQEFYPIFGVIFGFMAMAVAYALVPGPINF